jgi:hypothetical protein
MPSLPWSPLELPKRMAAGFGGGFHAVGFHGGGFGRGGFRATAAFVATGFGSLLAPLPLRPSPIPLTPDPNG